LGICDSLLPRDQMLTTNIQSGGLTALVGGRGHEELYLDL
jgi:hypothetical protein